MQICTMQKTNIKNNGENEISFVKSNKINGFDFYGKLKPSQCLIIFWNSKNKKWEKHETQTPL